MVMINCKAGGYLSLVGDAALRSQKGKVGNQRCSYKVLHVLQIMGFREANRNFCVIFLSLHFLLGYLAGPAVLNGKFLFLAIWVD